MELWALVEDIRDAIKANTAIKNWCTTNYGQQHYVYVGAVDTENPPPQDHYPVIAIIPIGQDRSIEDRHGPMQIMLGFAVYDDTIITDANEVRLEGTKNVLAFRETVEGVLFASTTDYSGAWIESAPEALDDIVSFPIFTTKVIYTFRNPDCFNPIVNP